LNRVIDITNGSTFATIEYSTCCTLRTKLTLGNGSYTEYDYDDARRLTKITNKKSNGTVISSWDYAYDDVGNVTSQTDNDSLVSGYTYDDIYQLTAVDYPSGSDYGYEYDAVGNRTKMFEYTSSTITTTYTYDDADELTQWTTSTVTMTFTYASDGCLSTKSDGTDTWTYDWDYERRLKAFKKNSATLVEYAYSPTGTRRYSSDSTLGVTNYFYSGNHVLADYTSNWTLEKSYILGPRIDEIIVMIDRTTKDKLGSTRELMSDSETVDTRYEYDAWGDPTETQLIASVSTRYRGAGVEFLTAGLYASGRMYDPSEGRDTKANFDRISIIPDGGRYNINPPGDPSPIACCSTGMFHCDPARHPGYCEVNHEECRQRCEMDLACDRNYHKALCYRCCQAAYKRCWLDGCGAQASGVPGEYVEGPPLKCKNNMFIEKCHQACHASNYYPRLYCPLPNEPCDDEGGNHNWNTIMTSAQSVCIEYGNAVRLVAISLPDPAPVEPPVRLRCQKCYYQWVGTSTGLKPFFNITIFAEKEQCPAYFPKALSGYWADEQMWNSCGPWPE